VGDRLVEARAEIVRRVGRPIVRAGDRIAKAATVGIVEIAAASIAAVPKARPKSSSRS
jgi:hypothetical protein